MVLLWFIIQISVFFSFFKFKHIVYTIMGNSLLFSIMLFEPQRKMSITSFRSNKYQILVTYENRPQFICFFDCLSIYVVYSGQRISTLSIAQTIIGLIKLREAYFARINLHLIWFIIGCAIRAIFCKLCLPSMQPIIAIKQSTTGVNSIT